MKSLLQNISDPFILLMGLFVFCGLGWAVSQGWVAGKGRLEPTINSLQQTATANTSSLQQTAAANTSSLQQTATTEKTRLASTISSLQQTATTEKTRLASTISSLQQAATTETSATPLAVASTIPVQIEGPKVCPFTLGMSGPRLLINGLRFEGNNSTNIRMRNIASSFYDFPEFKEWCTEGITEYLTTRGIGTSVEFNRDLLRLTTERQGPSQLLIMLTAEQDPSNSIQTTADLPDLLIGRLSIKNIDGSSGGEIELKLGSTIALWDYHSYRETVSPNNPDKRYVRIWSGYNTGTGQPPIGEKAVQITALIVDLEDIGQLQNFSITDTSARYNLNIFGVLFLPKNLPSENSNSRPIFKPFCPDENNVTVNGFARSLLRSDIIELERDYYHHVPLLNDNRCRELLPEDESLVRALAPSTKALPPLVLWEKLYETRPTNSEVDGRGGVDATIAITVPEDISEVKQIHLMLNARNLCHPSMSRETGTQLRDSTPLAKVKLTYKVDGQEETRPFDVIVGRDIRQGRSGIRSGIESLACVRTFSEEGKGRPGPPISARFGEDTENKDVAIWLDVLTIDVTGIDPDGIKLSKIEIIDNFLSITSRTYSSQNGSDGVDYTDPYLTLYGITLEMAPTATVTP